MEIVLFDKVKDCDRQLVLAKLEIVEETVTELVKIVFREEIFMFAELFDNMELNIHSYIIY